MADIDDLPLTNSHWGTYAVETGDDGVTTLHDFAEDDDPSPIGHGIVDVLEGPTRIDAPMVRKSWLEGDPGTATDTAILLGLAQGPTAHSCLVDLERADNPPDVTAFDPPEIQDA